MKTKLVIALPDTKNRTITTNAEKRKKNRDGYRVVRDGTDMYLLDDKTHRLTFRRFGFIKVWYVTYYYEQGHPYPIPFGTNAGRNIAKVTADKDTVPKGYTAPDDIVGSDVPGEELNALFEPWFYRQIAPTAPTLGDTLGKYVSYATLAVVVYLTWKLQSAGAFEVAQAAGVV